jgi:hypothetical protein
MSPILTWILTVSLVFNNEKRKFTQLKSTVFIQGTKIICSQYISVEEQLSAGQGRLILEVSRPHTMTHHSW